MLSFIFVTMWPLNTDAQNKLEDIVGETNVSKPDSIPQIDVGHNPSAVAVDPLTNYVYVANSGDNTVSVINPTTLSKKDIRVGINPVSIAINPNTNDVYVANSGDNTVSVIDGKTNTKGADVKGVFPRPHSIGVYNGTPNRVYVANSGDYTVSVIDADSNSVVEQIELQSRPFSLAVDSEKPDHRIYVTHPDSSPGMLSIITHESPDNRRSSDNNTSSSGEYSSREFPIANAGNAIDVNSDKGSLYVTDNQSNTVSVIEYARYRELLRDEKIDTVNQTEMSNNETLEEFFSDINRYKITQEIRVGQNPVSVAIDPYTDLAYVANAKDNTVSLIDGKNNTLMTDINVGPSPASLDLNPNTNKIYSANRDSNGISIIDGSSKTTIAGIKLYVNPPGSGHIKCNGMEFPTGIFLYVDFSTLCTAESDTGFLFDNWVQNLKYNSSSVISPSESPNSPYEYFLTAFGLAPKDNSFNVTQYGNYTANFQAISSPIPAQYLIPLYAIIVSSVIGWFVPGIIGWIKSRQENRRYYGYHRDINMLYNDGKLNDMEYKSLDEKTQLIDKIKAGIEDSYTKGKISDRHYQNLKCEISLLNKEIFNKRIYLNDSPDTDKGKSSLLQIKYDLEETYTKGKMSDKHYGVLNKRIDSILEESNIGK